jgi:predicted ATPase
MMLAYMNTPPWYVLTGGPCAGKTTLAEALRERGHAVQPEPGRIYFEAKLAEGKTIEELLSDMTKLEHDILQQHIEMEKAFKRDSLLFLDRGIPDCLAYYRVYNVTEDAELEKALANCSYRKIFLLDLIENFANDAVRVETPEQAKRIHDAIESAYIERGYEVVTVPVMPIQDRADFVLSRLG